MFGRKNDNKEEKIEVLNPLRVTKDSIIEFNIGLLAGLGIFRFKKIIEFNVNGRKFIRYLIYSKSLDKEYIFEIFPKNENDYEASLFELADTVPFSTEFLDVVGQKYLTTPDENEYIRCIMPEEDERIEGISATIRVYDIEEKRIQKECSVKLWDYSREVDNNIELLNVEMMEDTGMFRIFIGERSDEIFYKIYVSH